MGIVDVLHLFLVGAGDYGYLYVMTVQVGDKGFYTRDIFIGHLFLEDVEFRCDFLLCFGESREVFLVDLRQSLSFDPASEIFFVQIFQSLFVPENGVLCLCIHNDTVEVEQCRNCLCCIHIKLSFYLKR